MYGVFTDASLPFIHVNNMAIIEMKVTLMKKRNQPRNEVIKYNYIYFKYKYHMFPKLAKLLI